MKLFLREHLPLTLAYALQLLLVFLVFWLSDHSHLLLALYAMLLSTTVYLGYLTYRFVTHRELYIQLTEPAAGLEAFAGTKDAKPLPAALQQLLQKQFRQYQQQTHTYEQMLDQHLSFIHQWVHQMKTPVAVLDLMLQQDELVSEDIREELDRIEKGLQTILYTARLNHFTHDFHAETLSLHSLMKQVISEHKRLFIRKRVFPQVHIPVSLRIASDEKWLAFTIGQVLTNAVRYSAGKSEMLHISASFDGTAAVLEMQDFGIGIPPQDVRRVFQPYFPGKNGRTYGESTGMGLYLVQQICQHLGHTVEIESQEGAGTTVRIRFIKAWEV